jgi:hypothetical protein
MLVNLWLAAFKGRSRFAPKLLVNPRCDGNAHRPARCVSNQTDGGEEAAAPEGFAHFYY